MTLLTRPPPRKITTQGDASVPFSGGIYCRLLLLLPPPPNTLSYYPQLLLIPFSHYQKLYLYNLPSPSLTNPNTPCTITIIAPQTTLIIKTQLRTHTMCTIYIHFWECDHKTTSILLGGRNSSPCTYSLRLPVDEVGHCPGCRAATEAAGFRGEQESSGDEATA